MPRVLACPRLAEPGIVPKVTRSDVLNVLPEDRRHARMRANLSQYIEACAELGIARSDLITAADLLDPTPKGWERVLRNLGAVARVAPTVPDYAGPLIAGSTPLLKSSRRSGHGQGGTRAPRDASR